MGNLTLRWSQSDPNAYDSYGCPLAIYQCPDMAAFLASNPMANIRPFAEVPAAMIAMGHEVMDCFE